MTTREERLEAALQHIASCNGGKGYMPELAARALAASPSVSNSKTSGAIAREGAPASPSSPEREAIGLGTTTPARAPEEAGTFHLERMDLSALDGTRPRPSEASIAGCAKCGTPYYPAEPRCSCAVPRPAEAGPEAEDPMTPSERGSMAVEYQGTCFAVRRGTGGGVSCELPLYHRGPHISDGGGHTWPADPRPNEARPLCKDCDGTGIVLEDATGALGLVVNRECRSCDAAKRLDKAVVDRDWKAVAEAALLALETGERLASIRARFGLDCEDAGDGTCAIEHQQAETRCSLPGGYQPRPANAWPAQPGDPTVRHVVAWMRATYPQNAHAQEWADEIGYVFLGERTHTFDPMLEGTPDGQTRGDASPEVVPKDVVTERDPRSLQGSPGQREPGEGTRENSPPLHASGRADRAEPVHGSTSAGFDPEHCATCKAFADRGKPPSLPVYVKSELWDSARLKMRQLEAEIHACAAPSADKSNLLHTFSKLCMFASDAWDMHVVRPAQRPETAEHCDHCGGTAHGRTSFEAGKRIGIEASIAQVESVELHWAGPATIKSDCIEALRTLLQVLDEKGEVDQ